MSESCQHCGTKLPWKVDAFCPTCRSALDEMPEPVTAFNPHTSEGVSDVKKTSSVGLITMMAGLCTAFPCLFSTMRHAYADALFTGGVGLLLVVGGLVWQLSLNRNAKDSAP